MKQRITYIVRNPERFSPENLIVKDDGLSLSDVNAAKEHRITFGLAELPLELYRVLKQCHELHIRWASERPYKALSPFVSRVSPGLHAFFTPQKTNDADLLCPILKKVFDDNLKCQSPKETFIKVPILSERFSMSATHEYYSLLPSLQNLVTYVREKICTSASSGANCRDQASSLLSASYLDIDYDAISHALVLSAFWPSSSHKSGIWTETITHQGQADHVEVGILSNEPNPDPEDIAFNGFLVVLGQDSEPKPTQFQTPNRHYALPPTHALTYHTSFSHPTGLHPTLQITLSSPSSSPGTPSPNALTSPFSPPDPSCKLHTHITLPSSLFIDKHQFTDALFLSSHSLTSLHSLSGSTDLEAPDWVIPSWGSSSLFEIALPSSNPKLKTSNHSNYTISIPMHARYLPPSNTSDKIPVAVPWPVVFWACHADAGNKMTSSPFDRTNLGFDTLFGPKTRFMYLDPEIPATPKSKNIEINNMDGMSVVSGNVDGNVRLMEVIDIPVLETRYAGVVEWGTLGVVLLAFVALVAVLFGKGDMGGDAKRKDGTRTKEQGKKMQ